MPATEIVDKFYGDVQDRLTTISTHLIHPPGVAALRRWGLLDRLVANGCPPVDTSASGMRYSFPQTLESRKPKFFIQGEADEVCPIEAMWAFYGKLAEPKELVVIDAADHLFEGKTQEAGEALEDLLGDFYG